ncbi:histidine kinase [Nocardiopsis sp. NPDC007018]|uniref:sensor histidine kinase n=1 Tax=Nocardiopsis sp. NPDC007018 TaxID=3155721 RepID=UPI0033E43E7D
MHTRERPLDALARRWRRLPVTTRDAALTALLASALLVGWPFGPESVPPWLVSLSQLACCLPLVWRRRFPFPSALTVGTAVFVHHAVLGFSDPFTIWLACFAAWSAVRHGSPVSLVAPLSAVWMLAFFNIVTHGDMLGRESLPQQLSITVLAMSPALVGSLVRLRVERAAQRRRANLDRAQRERARERARIARDVHDVAGHHLSAIRLLAVGGRESLKGPDGDPDAVLAAISEASGRAVREMRELLQLLREDRLDEPAPPDVLLDDLPFLVAALDDTGLAVDLEVPEAVEGLPARLEADAYRIVQEALGNVLRHSSAESVLVRLESRTDGAGRELVVTVEDDGSPAPGGRGGRSASTGEGPPGLGLRGIRERAEGWGGRSEAGFGPGRGWRVRARLPVPGRPESREADPGQEEVDERDQGAVGR